MTRLSRTAKPIPDAEARWPSLHAVVPRVHRRGFVRLCAVRLTDGTRIDAFAHTWTRRELLLGDDGAAFARTPSGRFKARPDLDFVVEQALPHRWEWLEMGGYVSFDVGPEPGPEEEWSDEGRGYVERSRPRALAPGEPAGPATLGEGLAS